MEVDISYVYDHLVVSPAFCSIFNCLASIKSANVDDILAASVFSFDKRGRATSLRLTLLTWKIFFLYSLTRDLFHQRQWNLTAALHNWDFSYLWFLGQLDLLMIQSILCACLFAIFQRALQSCLSLHQGIYYEIQIVLGISYSRRNRKSNSAFRRARTFRTFRR